MVRVKEPHIRGLVSLEGDADAISTQLRLLPQSSKVLVLPPFSSAIPVPRDDVVFNARAYVRQVYEVLSGRIMAARSFLESSTTTQPRLAFMNGGCISARIICISTISEKVTNGDFKEAERLFQEIVNEEFTAITRRNEIAEKNEATSMPVGDDVDSTVMLQSRTSTIRAKADPGAVAMKAAEDLDRATAGLQISFEDEVEDGNFVSSMQSTRHNSIRANPTLPKLGSKGLSEEQIGMLKRSIPGHRISTDERRHLFGRRPYSLSLSMPNSMYAETVMSDERNESEKEATSPSVDRRPSVPTSPQPVKFGEGSHGEADSSISARMNRDSDLVDYLPPIVQSPPLSISPPPSRPASISPRLEAVGESILEMESKGTSKRSISSDDLPQTSSHRTSQAIQRTSSIMETSEAEAPRAFVDRGTDPQPLSEIEAQSIVSLKASDVKRTDRFDSGIDIVEDIIIQLADGVSDEAFDAVVRSYTNVGLKRNSSTYSPSPLSITRTASPYGTKLSVISQTSDEEDGEQGDGIYGQEDPSVARRILRQKESSTDTARTTARASRLTSLKKLPAIPADRGMKIHKICPSTLANVAKVQDSLRGVLNSHYPPDATKYRQHTFPTDNDRFWKPIFQKDESSAKGARTVNLMIAVGHEEGVDKGFYYDVVDQIDKLGDGKSGRTSKLDITYLIIYAMQTFTSQPLSLQMDQNPFTQPSLLATLIIPHLETYLANNGPTNLLVLHYPAVYLSTILALRDLIGSDLFRVAGMVQSLAIIRPQSLKSKKSFITSLNKRISFASSHAPSAKAAAEINNLSSRITKETPQFHPSFAKADFLLASKASPSEVVAFLSAIRKALSYNTSFPTAISATPSTTLLATQYRDSTPGTATTTSLPFSATHPHLGPAFRPRVPSRRRKEYPADPAHVATILAAESPPRRRRNRGRLEHDEEKRMEAEDQERDYNRDRDRDRGSEKEWEKQMERERERERDRDSYYTSKPRGLLNGSLDDRGFENDTPLRDVSSNKSRLSTGGPVITIQGVLPSPARRRERWEELEDEQEQEQQQGEQEWEQRISMPWAAQAQQQQRQQAPKRVGSSTKAMKWLGLV